MQRLTKEREEALWQHKNVQTLIELERTLEREAMVKMPSSIALNTNGADRASREVSAFA